MSRITEQARMAKRPEETEEIPSDPIAAVTLKLGRLFASLFLVSMVILIFEVVMRYVFDRPTIWVHETTIFICAICFVFGGLHCVSRNGHIRVVLLYDHVSADVRRRLDIAIYTICGFATGMFSYSIWPTVVKSFWAPTGEFRMITSGSAWNPPYPTLLRAFLFLVLIAMTMQFAILVFNRIRRKSG
ncbi:TRAP transporter small permease subunit [Thioalkalivibrio sp. HK1]|uniref:TRAP transporter small permease subunit n=1 Tax=Thioalkalivibrio sp. HK1 TaxID=1469245 RepID=UPI00047245C1|nr:TRAP transporter small permease [Thioalkalivibrio sp. HK1]